MDVIDILAREAVAVGLPGAATGLPGAATGLPGAACGLPKAACGLPVHKTPGCISVKSKSCPGRRCNRRFAPGSSQFCSIHRRVKVPQIFANNHTLDERRAAAIVVQKNFRCYLVRRRKRCVNETDFYTMDPVADIPDPYYLDIMDGERGCRRRYGFDARSLFMYIKSNRETKSIKNPYTQLDLAAAATYKINAKISYLQKKGVALYMKESASEPFALAQQVCIYMERLGQYADADWFLLPSLADLKKLYLAMQNMWKYQLNISERERKRIVKDGTVFEVPPYIINSIVESDIDYLHFLLLRDFLRMVREGKHVANRKYGATLIMNVIMESSKKIQAAFAAESSGGESDSDLF